MEVLLNGKPLRLNPRQIIGQGSEAYVYSANGLAVKIFKDSNHPDYAGNPTEQTAAQTRLTEHQKKLRVFPSSLPPHVVVPEILVSDKTGTKITGYAMKQVANAERLVSYSDQSFRRKGIDSNQVVEIFRDLFVSVKGLHRQSVIIGDFKNLNVLVVGSEAYLIDTDSFQFGPYLCTMYSDLFLDPLLSDPNDAQLSLSRPYTAEADWYAFNVMLLESLLYVHPYYGGVYRPKNQQLQIPRERRPLKRISIFHPEVIYPKPAFPLAVLSDDLLNHFERVFTKDQRGEFPEGLLSNLHWTSCTSCGVEHARSICPNCQTSIPMGPAQLTKVRGKVIVNRLFQTEGVILFAAVEEGKLVYLYNEKDKFFREGRRLVLNGELNPSLFYQIAGKTTIFSQGNQSVLLQDGQVEKLTVENVANKPVVVSSEDSIFWAEAGELKKQGLYGPMHWGNILHNQTQVWLGPTFGFGFYRAGSLEVYFVFDNSQQGIRDDIKLPAISGELIETTVVFSEKYCWFLLSVQEKTKRVHHCYQISSKGEVVAQASGEKGDGSWLGELDGKSAFQDILFAPTDDGIVRVEEVNGSLEKTAEFLDTEPFVTAKSQLFTGEGGMFIVSNKEIWHLKIN